MVKPVRSLLSLGNFTLVVGVAIPLIAAVVAFTAPKNSSTVVKDRIFTVAEFESQKLIDAEPKFYRVMVNPQTGERMILRTSEAGLRQLLEIQQSFSLEKDSMENSKDFIHSNFKPPQNNGQN